MKIKMNNKRSLISGEVIMFIPQIIFLIAVLFAFVILVKSLVVTAIDVRPVDASILVERMLFSRNGISYYDEGIGRLYPGIIDLGKFKEISGQTDRSYTLEEDARSDLDEEVISYGSDSFLIAANLTLTLEGGERISAYYNKKWFDRWKPRTIISLCGPGAVRQFIKTRNVLVKEGDTISYGSLIF